MEDLTALVLLMKGNVVVNSKVLPQSQGYVSSLIVGIEFVCVYIGECVFDGNVCIVPCNSLKKAKYFYYFVIFQKKNQRKIFANFMHAANLNVL